VAEKSPRLQQPSDIESTEHAILAEPAAAPAMRHQSVLEEGVSRIGVDYAAILTADSSLGDYDEQASGLLKERTLTFLHQLG
jgi:hypothetical protein